MCALYGFKLGYQIDQQHSACLDIDSGSYQVKTTTRQALWPPSWRDGL